MYEFIPKPIKGKIGFEEEYYVLVDNIPVPISDRSLEISLPATVFSLPTNEKKEINTAYYLESVGDITKVAKYYGKFPIGAIVEGEIWKGLFQISKIIKYPRGLLVINNAK